MKLLKPVWVNHDGQPIFSVDIHPDGSKFATGGQGGDAGRVCLWSIGPIIDEKLEKNDSVPKLLCQMDNHLACVNVVRWSQSGKFLASAGDDQIIMIWQISKYLGSSTSSIFRGAGNVEQWRCIATLRGHSGDILDLNWSPQDEYIASGSVDNNVIVWNARNFPEVVARLNGHNGFVKGVSWDPIGKYVASQSDDKSVKVWRTKDWKEETTVSEPFRDCGGTTHVLRLNWSPDGQFLVSAHAMNNRGSTAQIIERDGWKAQKDFVGHRKAVTCVRFNPNILEESSNFYTLIALGSRDKSISVWSTKNKRPTLVIHDLFESSVLDLTWSRDGYSLLSCSWDGSVAFIRFEPGEIGKLSSQESKTAYFQKLYGKSLQSPSKETLLIEDPEILKIREKQLKKKEKEKQLSISNKDSKSPNSLILQNGSNNFSSKSNLSICDKNKVLKGPTDKQIETRMPNGRKRITPIFIPLPTDCEETPISFTATTFSSSDAPSDIPSEKREGNTSTPIKINEEKDGESPVSLVNQSSKPGVSSTAPLPSPSPIKAPRLSGETNQTKQDEPSVDNETTNSLTSPNTASKNNTESTEKRPISPTSNVSPSSAVKKVKLSNPPSSQPVKVLNKPNESNQTKQANGQSSQLKKSLSTDKRKGGRTGVGNITKTPTPPTSTTRPEEKTDNRPLRSESKVSAILSSLKIDKSSNLLVKITGDDGTKKNLIVEVENNISNSALSIVRVLNQENDKVWEMVLSSKICGLSACPYLVAVACSDLTLSVFSTTTGRRLHTPLTLDSPASRLNCYKHYLLVVTNKASVWLWDFENHSVKVKNESIYSLLSTPSNSTIVNTGITETGSPVITLSSGKSFVFDLSFGSWSLVSNGNDLLNFFSDYKQTWRPESSSYPLAILQSQNSLIKTSHNIFLSNSNLQKTGTLSFLDQQLTSSLILGSSKEYRQWLITLAQFLTEEGIEPRLRELCQFLLGPPFSSSDSNWESTILGNEKHELLREVLAITTSNLKLQRIYTEFKQQLDLISSASSSSFL
ncbi:protein HIRA [Tetranychus urticae]|uniref:Protein HIRA n=1 Tax=Tetranychus urticae TaxID=32264 RepID=T1JPP5_TETUR|nr:protein HIRA [Tetranychus urticae]